MIKRLTFMILGFLLTLPPPAFAAEYDTGVKARVLLQTETTSIGDPIVCLKSDKPKITVMTVDIASKAQTGWHYHPVPVYAYVASGNLTVEFQDGRFAEFKEGDAIIEVVNLPHNGVNRGDVPVKLVVFYTGGKDIPNVIKSDKP
jgi:quercetin dioxygenase-like cupin family protein